MILSRRRILYFYQRQDFKPLFDIDRKFFKWRQIRLLLSNGKFLKVKRNISSSKELKKVFLKFAPLKAYYMVARFSQPRSVGAKEGPKGAGYVVADNCFLYQDEFVFDVDEDPEKNVPKLVTCLKKWGLEIKYICFSGSRGYHVCVKRPLRLSIEDPAEREEVTLVHNRALIEKVLNQGIAVDDTSNTRQIVKIPLSLDGTTGKECFLVEDVKSMGLANPRGDESKPFEECNTGDGGGSSPTPRPQLLLCFSNNVLGTRGRYISFLKFENLKKEQVRSLLKEIKRDYGVGSFYVFQKDGIFAAVSLETVDFRRLVKILRFARQWDLLNALRKYKHNILELYFLKKVIARTSPSGKPISKGHFYLFKMYGIPCFPSSRFVGNGKVKVGLYAEK